MNSFENAYSLLMPRTKEEKIEEARRSGLIGKSEKDIKDVPGNPQRLYCKRCGSPNVICFSPNVDDVEKGGILPYQCKDCGYEGTRGIRIVTFDDKTMVVDLLPDGLIGVVDPV